jgi:hypothetical protein
LEHKMPMMRQRLLVCDIERERERERESILPDNTD